jgi:hypothetical protein
MELPALVDQGINRGLDNSFDSGQRARPTAKPLRPSHKLKDEPMTAVTSPPVGELIDDMETPVVVRALLARIIDLPQGEDRAYEREFKLSYYYEGLLVALTSSDKGPAVVASGTNEEVLAALDGLSRHERAHITLVTPQSLCAIAAELGRAGGPGAAPSAR